MSFNECSKPLNSAYELLRRGKVNVELVTKWIKHGTITLRHLGRLLRSDGASVGEKQKVLASIAQVKCASAKLKTLLKVGGGQQRDNLSARVQWRDLESAFENRLRTGVIVNIAHIDIAAFLTDAQALIKPRIKNGLKRDNGLKINAVLTTQYKKGCSDGEETIETKTFKTKNAAVFSTTNLDDWYIQNVREPIFREMEEFQERDSGWTLHSITCLTVNMNRYNPMRGSSYIDLPAAIKRKKACVNVRNADRECFKWAILSALHPPIDNPDRVSKYKQYKDQLNFKNIELPVMPKDIHKFEKQNNISVNVYMLRKSKSNQFSVSPTHLTSLKRDKHVNLLMVQNYYACEESEEEDQEEDETPARFHYVWICDLSRLVSRQLSKKKTKKYICDRCLHYFYNNEKLEAHEVDCIKFNMCRVTLPTLQNNTLKFKNHNNKERVPVIIYADFECMLKKPEVQSDKQQGRTEIVQVHEAFSVGYYFKCSYDNSLSRYAHYRGEKPAEWFVQELIQLAEDVETVFWCTIPMIELSAEQERDFHRITTCHICEEPLLDKKRVRDHCHLTGKYRGPAHEACNLNYQDSRTIPVVFHNLSGYDSHFIIKEISTCFEGRVNILPINMERYISFTKHVKDSDIAFRFIDSFRFMASSLDKLAGYLTELSIVQSEFPQLDDERFQLLKRKGIFPYEYVDTWNKLSVTELPPKEDFYSHLTDCSVSEKDYQHATRVWTAFKIKNLGEYSDLYLKTDVLLLAEVFENFRTNCLKAYGLDPAHYYTTPGLTWDAMLKYTKVKLELLTDIDMMLFIERGIRGGVSQCSNRYAAANNKYMPDYDPEEESKYLMYYDVNNLYGWAMTQYLPHSGFKWIEDINSMEWDVADDSSIGYILEVDLEYPEILHDAHSDLPLCPEQMKPPGSSESKLLTTLYPKCRYVLHYRNLKQALLHGLKLVKIHRILEFHQSPWLRDYINLNTEMRKKAQNEFEKNLYKLMNNAVFGKTMENVRKRATIKLVTKWAGRYGAEVLIAKPNFHARTIFSENLIAVQLMNTEVLMNKPIYVGLAVLDISKICVYDFHYGYMQHAFKDQSKLLYTDTDSLIYEIRHSDIYEVMKRDISHFDTSDYPPNNNYNIPQANKKVIGLMKDECCGRIMTEFVGLRSKMYSVRVEGEDILKKAKGVKAAVVKKTITFNDYVECLRKNISMDRTQYTFRSKLHEMQTMRQTKVVLSPHDNKRYLMPDTTDTLPWGHFRNMDTEV